MARARFIDGRLEGLERIFAVARKSGGSLHFGSRLVFGTDGTLYITAGERGDSERAQDPRDAAGSVVRVTDSGAIPPDNPFLGRSDALPEIFSLGHRNPQGLTRHPETGRIWAVEHGPRGGDELNLLHPGANYGWPVITHGKSYAGFKIGEGSAKPGMEQPAAYWVPSISPSGLTFYTGDAFPRWRGSLFLGALSGEMLVRLELDREKVVREERPARRPRDPHPRRAPGPGRTALLADRRSRRRGFCVSIPCPDDPRAARNGRGLRRVSDRNSGLPHGAAETFSVLGIPKPAIGRPIPPPAICCPGSVGAGPAAPGRPRNPPAGRWSATRNDRVRSGLSHNHLI